MVRAVANGLPKHEAARRFGVGLTTVKRYVAQQEQTGSLRPKPIPGMPRRIRGEHEALLRERLQAAPDATVAEHCAWWQEHHGQTIPVPTMWLAIRRLGGTHKKNRWWPASATKQPGRPGEKPSRRGTQSSSVSSTKAAPRSP